MARYTARDGDECMRCHAGTMRERTARTTGNRFMGCDQWPACTFTTPVAKAPASTERLEDAARYATHVLDRVAPVAGSAPTSIIIDEGAKAEALASLGEAVERLLDVAIGLAGRLDLLNDKVMTLNSRLDALGRPASTIERVAEADAPKLPFDINSIDV